MIIECDLHTIYVAVLIQYIALPKSVEQVSMASFGQYKLIVTSFGFVFTTLAGLIENLPTVAGIENDWVIVSADIIVLAVEWRTELDIVLGAGNKTLPQTKL